MAKRRKVEYIFNKTNTNVPFDWNIRALMNKVNELVEHINRIEEKLQRYDKED